MINIAFIEIIGAVFAGLYRNRILCSGFGDVIGSFERYRNREILFVGLT